MHRNEKSYQRMEFESKRGHMKVNRNGIEYFPHITSFYSHLKNKLLLKKFGSNGIVMFDMIECYSHGTNGYFIEEDECLKEIICIDLDLTENTYDEILSYLIDNKFLVRKQCSRYGNVITSEKMQNDFAVVAKDRARKRRDRKYPVDKEIWLFSEDDYEWMNPI